MMDRRVKERLIGASILVILVVLVVPELLSGPKSAAPQLALPAAASAAAAAELNRTVTVDLSTSKSAASSESDDSSGQPASAAAAPTAPAASPASVPTSGETAARAAVAPATSAGQAPAVSAPAAVVAPKPAHPTAVESAAPPPTSALRGSWSVQLGSFQSRSNADNLTRQLKEQGFTAFVLAGGSGTAVRYRVRVGPLSDRESAERMAAKLKALKHDASLVSPTG